MFPRVPYSRGTALPALRSPCTCSRGPGHGEAGMAWGVCSSQLSRWRGKVAALVTGLLCLNGEQTSLRTTLAPRVSGFNLENRALRGTESTLSGDARREDALITPWRVPRFLLFGKPRHLAQGRTLNPGDLTHKFQLLNYTPPGESVRVPRARGAFQFLSELCGCRAVVVTS